MLTIQGPSRLPDELEKKIFKLAARDAGAIHYLLVAKRVHHWLEPHLYCSVTIHSPRGARLFVSALKARPHLARTSAVKALCLRPSVPPEEGAQILWLCEVVESLTLQIPVNRPEEENPLIEPLDRLPLTYLSINLSAIFFNPSLQLSDRPALTRVHRLHISNAWVLVHGVALGIQQLQQLTHLSLHARFTFTGMDMDLQTLQSILTQCSRLQVLLLWRMEYEDYAQVQEVLHHGGLEDHRIVIFNASFFYALTKNGMDFWSEAEEIVRQREAE